MRLKSLVRSFAALAFALMFLMGAFARPVLAQSDDDAASAPDAKGPKLHVSKTTINFGNVIATLQSNPETVTLTNKSASTAVTITSIEVNGTFPFSQQHLRQFDTGQRYLCRSGCFPPDQDRKDKSQEGSHVQRLRTEEPSTRRA